LDTALQRGFASCPLQRYNPHEQHQFAEIHFVGGDVVQSTEVAQFRRVAWKRFEEAEFLLKGGYTTGAMYLSGYAVECMLKSLLIAQFPKRSHKAELDRCKQEVRHDLERLKHELAKKGVVVPGSVLPALVLVRTWTPEMRYESAARHVDEAEDFLAAVKAILDWAKGKLS